MLKMDIMQKILMMHIHEGRSRREIARETGINRETVGKYIKQYEERRRQLLAEGNSSVDVQALIDALTTAPKYKVSIRPKRKLTAEIIEKIKQHLNENEEKRSKGMRKQQKKPMDIFEALEAEGVEISYSTVLRTIREIESKPKEAFIKGAYAPGDICEFDWGEVKLTINGKTQTFQMAVFTSAYGNYRFAYLFTKQTTECFQEAHALFFQHINGIYRTMVYDNMRVAVKRFVGTGKEPTEGLLKLSLYYGFQYRFCNIHSGNEKGHVERSVDVVRRKAFAFRDTFESLEEANRYLDTVCAKRNQKPQIDHQGQTANELLKQEREGLLPALPMFDAARVLYCRADKYATVAVDQNRYSVPDHLVGKQIMVKVYATRILCFHDERRVAEHARLTGCHEWKLELSHYLETLKKKPGALAGSAALQQASQKIKNIYEAYYTKREKDFVQLLQFIRDDATLAEVERSIAELCNIHVSHVVTDKIKVLCAKNREMFTPMAQPSQTACEIADWAKEHLRMYDDLFHTQKLETEEAIA
jgi:transposase/transposase-like protein